MQPLDRVPRVAGQPLSLIFVLNFVCLVIKSGSIRINISALRAISRIVWKFQVNPSIIFNSIIRQASIIHSFTTLSESLCVTSWNFILHLIVLCNISYQKLCSFLFTDTFWLITKFTFLWSRNSVAFRSCMSIFSKRSIIFKLFKLWDSPKILTKRASGP